MGENICRADRPELVSTMDHQNLASERRDSHQSEGFRASIIESPIAVSEGTLADVLVLLMKRKRLVLGVPLLVAFVTMIVTLLLPKYYRAETKILPPQQSESLAASMLGQLGSLASLAGRDLGLKNPLDMYVAMLRSRTIGDDLIDRFNLMQVYKAKARMDGRSRLEELTTITSGRDGVITVSVEDREPRRAADIANAYVEELEKLTQHLAVTDAGKRRLFFEREVKTASDELAAAEQSLKKTQESTGMIQLDNQSKVMLEAFANLRSQVTAKEVQIESMKSFATPENPALQRAQQELTALRAQLARAERGDADRSPAGVGLEKVPAAGLEYIRRLREVKYREALMELLLKQYEIARLDEAKDAAIIQVMDTAVPPERKSWPPRALIVSVCTLLAFFVAILWIYFEEMVAKTNNGGTGAIRLERLKYYLRHDGKSA